LKKKAGQSAGSLAMDCAGWACVYSPHKVYGAGQASLRCAGLMRAKPKRARPTRIATPRFMELHPKPH